ncbi:helix-turn-helix transcriptional regulator [Pseudomonas orientalis]|uniref:helix-turn-helix transcriptional regulator n=1 Tax=Pseudomonas orientalis TaxID=76758 RepID=UPI000F5832F1|nr:LuxR family transcriptional regulator [Pseudomonas orientalis]AZE91377.1 Transcriptional activator protein SolR [Pseudomonas orientalis]
MVKWRNTRLPKLEGESEITSMFEMVVNHTYELGFQYCSFTMSPTAQNTQLETITFSNHPNEWRKLYKQAHFFEIDPVVKRCKENVMPILWSKEAFDEKPQLWELAQSFGVHLGWTQAMHDFRGVFSMLNLARGKGEVSPQEFYEKAGHVLWLCHAMHTVVAKKYAARAPSHTPGKLTARETEVLKWSAMGKTASEIAAILCLSERTVGFHISSTFKKLGVHNKIQAVLSASKAGLF